MIIFWILTFFVGSSAFAFSYIYLQYDIVVLVFFAVIAMLCAAASSASGVAGSSCASESRPRATRLTRTVETNRAIFWRRALFMSRRCRSCTSSAPTTSSSSIRSGSLDSAARGNRVRPHQPPLHPVPAGGQLHVVPRARSTSTRASARR